MTTATAADASRGAAAGRRLRVGIAGAGMISHYHLIAWSRVGDEAEVVAICDPDLDKARQRAAAFGIANAYATVDAMLAAHALDALDVASPRRTHVEIIEHAAARGIDSICQKPLAPTLGDADGLLRRLRGTRLMVHENWRFRPWYRRLAELLSAGAIGEVRSADMSLFSSGMLPGEHGPGPVLVRQPFMAHERRMMIAEVLIHHLDVVRWLFGPLRVVAARAAHGPSEIAGETHATILLETGARAPVVVSGSLVAPGLPADEGDRLMVIGSTGSARIERTRLDLFGPAARSETFDFSAGYQASFDAVVAHFVACLRSGAPFETDVLDNIETLRLVEHAYWAAGLPA